MKSRVEIEREAMEVLQDLTRASGPGFTKLVRLVGISLRVAIPKKHRVLVVLSGGDPARVGAATARLLLYYEKVYRRVAGKRPLKVLYVFHDEFDDARLRKEIVKRAVKEKANMLEQVTARYEESDKYLGTTFQALVLDLTNDLKPNDVGRLVEVVEGGGIIVVQAPPWEEWDMKITLFKQNLLVPGYDEPRHVFISWFKRKLLEHKTGIIVYDTRSRKILSGEPEEPGEFKRREPKPPKKALFPDKVYQLALTQDQLEAVRLLEWMYEKPPKGRKKMIVITADRGRGKSSALGIGLVALAHELAKVKNRVRIAVTAPSPTNVQSLMELAMKTAEVLGLSPKAVKRSGRIIEIQGRKFSLEYWEPATVVKIQADIVAVDEASGIHVPLLHKIWRSHRRLVFSATIHGYEGAGRGFNVRFLSEVKKSGDTIIREFRLEEPIRYAPEDPVETWLYDALLLDAEPAQLEPEDLEDISLGNLEYLRLDPQWLFSKDGERVLRELFGIYVLAHYRNEPDDLGMLADAPHHSIRAIRTSRRGKIVAAAQVAEEGGLDEGMIDRLLRGEKIAGNIIPDRMLKHSRIREFGRMVGWRIVRIATHPEVQGRGIGSRLLRELYSESKERGYDWLGSGFGINVQLLRFWLKNGFTVLHLSPDRNPVSGEYTSLVMKPISRRAELSVRVAAREFKLKLLGSLHDTYSDMDVDEALLLLEMEPAALTPGYAPRLTKIQLDRLWIYNFGPMTYEAATDIIRELALAYWHVDPDRRPQLSDFEKKVLLGKALQAKAWSEVAEELGVREHKVMVALKEVVRKLSKDLVGVAEDAKVGVELEDLSEYELGLQDSEGRSREA